VAESLVIYACDGEGGKHIFVVPVNGQRALIKTISSALPSVRRRERQRRFV